MTQVLDKTTRAYWEAEMAKAEAAAQKAKTKAAVKKTNARMMECRMALRSNTLACSHTYEQ